MRLRRCHIVFIEPRERRGLDLKTLLASGEAQLASELEWLALAAHLDDAVAIDEDQLRLLGRLSPTQWIARSDLLREHSSTAIDGLLAKKLAFIEDRDSDNDDDRRLRDSHWRGLAAAMHRHLRWRGVDSRQALADHTTIETTLQRLGEPLPPVRERAEPDQRIRLGSTTGEARTLDPLIAQRTTCRNFDPLRTLEQARLSAVLGHVFAARAVGEVSGVTVLKKAVPSAGGLHPVEAYLLVRRVEGIAPGLYHYHPIDHALEPIKTLSDNEARHLAGVFVAHQPWFVDAPVQVILAARFRRNFWKYRNHAKAYRAVILDAGHLSQMQYLVATELGLGAFITAAINEGDIEDAFGLDPMEEGVLAVTGFGYRGDTMGELEFDPLGKVWPDQ